MEILKEIADRRSVRKYKSDEVEKEKIEAIINAARLAPTGVNSQPGRFLIITDEEIKKKIAFEDHNQQWMLTAPVLIVCMADINCRLDDYDEDLNETNPVFELKQIIRDSAIGIGYLLLEAQHLGLSTCWTAWFNQEDIRRAIDVPKNLYVNGVVSLGYGDEMPAARPRISLEEIMKYNKW